MPKLVDHEVRRQDLAEAVWRVVIRDGVEGASVRAVARAAGASMGSLRHYFGTQSELLAFAMRLVIDRVGRRVTALRVEGSPSPIALLSEVLPLDGERRRENEVWIAFTARSLVDPQLRELRRQAHAGLLALCRAAVQAQRGGPPGHDPAVESEHLHALIDGLALHAALDPEVATSDRLVTLLARHLDELGSR